MHGSRHPTSIQKKPEPAYKPRIDLGVDFNIITGRPNVFAATSRNNLASGKRGKVAGGAYPPGAPTRVGPGFRRSCDIDLYDGVIGHRARGTHEYNILKGKCEPKVLFFITL